MNKFKANIKRSIERYYNQVESINNEYSKYEGQVARNIYAPILIQEKLTEKITKLSDAKIYLNKSIDDEMLMFIDRANETNAEVIKSIEYQTRLSNVMNLLNIETNLDRSYFDFMAEAKDHKTLELLKEKYKSPTLIEVSNSIDPETLIASARTELFLLRNYIDNDKNFAMKDVILNSIV